MPVYAFECQTCGEVIREWQSIHDKPLARHAICGGRLKKILGPVRTHGIGSAGAKTREVDGREGRWAKDMPAYKRFRDRGLQPPNIDGCDHLEATAKSELAVSTGGKINVPDHVAQESAARAREITAGRL